MSALSALQDKTILITGASSGIGRALALALARRGNRVVIAARNSERLHELAQAAPAQLLPLTWDVADRSQIARVQSELQARFGWLDIAVLNAGTCEYLDAAAIDLDRIERVMAVNFTGMVNSVNALLPLLRAAPVRPYLVGISSMSTYLALPRAEAYGASKAALRYFLEALRVDLARDNIDVSVVSPGFVKTPLTERNDFAMPFIVDVDTAVRRIVAGMERRRLHIAFPRRLGWSLRLLAALPAAWSLRLVRRITGT